MRTTARRRGSSPSSRTERPTTATPTIPLRTSATWNTARSWKTTRSGTTARSNRAEVAGPERSVGCLMRVPRRAPRSARDVAISGDGVAATKRAHDPGAQPRHAREAAAARTGGAPRGRRDRTAGRDAGAGADGPVHRPLDAPDELRPG